MGGTVVTVASRLGRRWLVEASVSGLWTIDSDGRTTDVDTSLARALGYQPDELIGGPALDLLDPEGGRDLAEILDANSVRCAVTLRCRDGARFPVTLWTADADDIEPVESTVEAELGAVESMLLRAGPQLLQSIVDASTAVVYVKDTEGRYVLINRRYEEIFHVTKEWIVGKTDYNIFPRSRAKAFRAFDRQVLAAGVPLQSEEVAPHDDGLHTYISIKAPLYDEDGRACAVCGISTDITERTRAEEALRAAEERFRYVTVATRDAIYDWDIATNAVWRNEPYVELYGEPVGDDESWWEQHLHPDDRDRVMTGIGRVFADRSGFWSDEYRFRRADGSYASVLDRGHVLYDSDGKAVRMIGAITDMSARREAEEALRRSEEQLRQAQKMEAVGHLAGGIAHDFNNLLVAILGHAQLLGKRLPAGDPLRDHADQIREAGDRAAALTRQLLAFSRKQVLQPRVIDLNALIADTGKLLRRIIPEDVELVTSLGSEVGHVRADAGQLVQVLMNLAANARDAMPTGGRLVIATSEVLIDEKYVLAHPELEPGRYAMLMIADRGCGMDAATQARLFEPFFTTKEPGRGTGLGLSTVYGIVKQSRGHIAVESELGAGTTFRIYLPSLHEPVEPVTTQPAADDVAGHTGLILIAEDEAMVRRLVAEVLIEHGYEVIAVASPRDAITAAEGCARPIGVLLTDVVMPGMNGRQLAEQIAARHPETRPIFMSGYTSAAGFDSDVDGRIDFLEKPFATDVLLQKVREVMMRAR